jgi:N6-adenosine-specific RNA methylase IME4
MASTKQPTTPKKSAPSLASSYEEHIVAAVFPMMDDEKVAELAEDIGKNGQREPIKRMGGKILDGRARLAACKKAGVAPLFVDLDPVEDDKALDMAVSLNLKRRQLTPGQCASIAARIATMRLGQNQHSGGISQSQAAAMLGTSPDSIQRAKKVHQSGVAQLVKKMDDGKIDVHSAATIANQPAAEQEKILQQDAKQILAAARILKEKEAAEKKLQLAAKKRDLAAKSVPLRPNGDRYQVIYADPPWDYLPTGDVPYPTMDLPAILRMPVSQRAADDAVLFLWVPASLIAEGLEVVKAWGFTYKTHAVWRKGASGTGAYFRTNHEVLFFATRGKVFKPADSPVSCFDAPRGAHSAKPIHAVEMIEAMYPEFAGRLELFCRGNPKPGWAGWGNECVGSIDMPTTRPEAANDSQGGKDIAQELLEALGGEPQKLAA